jgi:hypothetical protein
LAFREGRPDPLVFTRGSGQVVAIHKDSVV